MLNCGVVHLQVWWILSLSCRTMLMC